jgi:hypothetical protein
MSGSIAFQGRTASSLADCKRVRFSIWYVVFESSKVSESEWIKIGYL